MVRFIRRGPNGVCCRNKHQLVVGWNENMITGKSVVQCEFKFRMNANKFYTIKYQQGSFHHFYFYQPISNCYISYSELYLTSRLFNNLTHSSTTLEELTTIQKQNQQRWIVPTKNPVGTTRAAVAHRFLVDPTIRKSRLSMTML